MARYNDNSHYTALRGDYMTPPAMYEPILKYFQRTEFDIDVCCTKPNIPAKKHFTKEIDGLKQDWDGLVFCNPPWNESKKWVQKAVETLKTNRNLTAVFVLSSDKMYIQYMQDYFVKNPHAAFLIIPKKQGFIIPDKPDEPPVPSVGTFIGFISRDAALIASDLNYYNPFGTACFQGVKPYEHKTSEQMTLFGAA